jgi:hypothetical protein
MRRKAHPSFPSAMTCCFFSSLKTLLMLTEAIGPLARVNVPGFIVGRFWVITEGESIPQLLPNSFKDANSRQFVDALGKGFLLPLELLLRRRLAPRHPVVNVAFLGLAKIENAASTLAVGPDQNAARIVVPMAHVGQAVPLATVPESYQESMKALPATSSKARGRSARL